MSGAKARGFCGAHYQRHNRGLPLEPPINPRGAGRICSVEGCDRRHDAKGFCNGHLQRSIKGLKLEAPWRGHAVTKGVDQHGYVTLRGPGVSAPGKFVLEHRHVVEQFLGRKLLPSESVRHLNGDRLDNRLENLTLEVKTQPVSQNIQDLVEWAKQLVAAYEDEAKRLASAGPRKC